MELATKVSRYVLITILLAGSGTAHSTQDAAALIQQAQSATDPETRIRLLGQAIKSDGGSFASFYLLGNALKDKSRLEESLEAYADALAKAPDYEKKAMALLREAEVCHTLGRHTEALADAKKSYDLHPFEQTEQLLTQLRAADGQSQPVSAKQISRALQTRGIVVEGGTELASPLGGRIDLPIHFEFNEARMTPAGLVQAQELGKALQAGLNGATIRIVGHTDRRGTYDYNMSLSRKRAEAVVDFLVREYAIPKQLFVAEGRGATEPVSDGASEEDFQLNRRVEIRVIQ